MTCGICEPQLFRPASGGRVFGYTAGLEMTNQIRTLHYQGCEFVWADQPQGQVRNRPNYKRLLRCLRKGDSLIVSDMKALGSRPKAQNAQLLQFEEMGVHVHEIINPEEESKCQINTR